MDNAVSKIFTVSKEEALKREAEWQRTHGRKKRAKNPLDPVWPVTRALMVQFRPVFVRHINT
jgi:hypothetical protein